MDRRTRADLAAARAKRQAKRAAVAPPPPPASAPAPPVEETAPGPLAAFDNLGLSFDLDEPDVAVDDDEDPES